ncbi:DUF4190 domain-containing protein [Leucobacter albus]|uniref:DUF4190 domain-containing protein n=1 Tax=Leucobacter albus TaxID=272210 RepID=A0ABW3TM67_9MICO
MTQLPPDPDQHAPQAEPAQPEPAQPVPGQQPAPEYGQPTQPQAAQPGYGQASEYGQPVQPGYGQPVQPGYGQPAPGYGQPVQPGYVQPGYAQPAYLTSGQYPPVKPPMNVFAIIGFIGVFFFSLVGIILGHIGLSQIKRTGESGRGLALAATIIGYVRIGIETIVVVSWLAVLGWFGFSASTSAAPTFPESDSGYSEEYDSQSGSGSDTGSTDGDIDFSNAPWVGTDGEAFCSALLTPDASVELGSVEYYENLLPLTEDPAARAAIEERIANVQATPDGSVGGAQDHFQNLSDWAEVSAELTFACLGVDSAP